MFGDRGSNIFVINFISYITQEWTPLKGKYFLQTFTKNISKYDIVNEKCSLYFLNVYKDFVEIV